jgi:hypothetical protein
MPSSFAVQCPACSSLHAARLSLEQDQCVRHEWATPDMLN